MRKLIPLALLLIGLCGGMGAGLLLRPDAALSGGSGDDLADADSIPDRISPDDAGAAPKRSGAHGGDYEYIKLDNQFIIPILTEDSIDSLILMSLSLEVVPGQAEFVYLHEPKLRDVFLQVMFDHANMGGFRGTFTATDKLESLRRSFLDVAQAVLGPAVSAVLITDIARQKT